MLILFGSWSLYEAIAPVGVPPLLALLTLLPALYLVYSYRNSKCFTPTLVYFLILLGYFLPIFLELTPFSTLSLDYEVLAKALSPLGFKVMYLGKEILIVQGNELLASYTLACSSLRSLMFLLFPLVCKCSWRRRIGASLAGLILGLPISWIRILVMFYLYKVFEVSIDILHYTVSPLITFILGLGVFMVQGKICEDAIEELLVGVECFFDAWEDCKKLRIGRPCSGPLGRCGSGS
ncbi:hypothetical protein IPA_08145 [Ignicoccus pacificus DSM 13166]|uniref:Exosortase/archaeosortase family protein n=1 Tax=Ignicoccus pacificus DSM 13166 TaxID=940294 RepID=A0A977KBU9_9CREN|nr:hypothetical protein IPA_08145 [Ignicoccus pacificus DSM 13166]